MIYLDKMKKTGVLLTGGYYWTIPAMAKLMKVDRLTVHNRIIRAGIKPKAIIGGTAVFGFKQAFRLING